jgi:acyl carrier protein
MFRLPIDMNEILAVIRSHLAQPLPLDADTALLSSGLIDSFALTGLISALESRFHVRIDPADIGVDNFDTPAQIQTYVDAHL